MQKPQIKLIKSTFYNEDITKKKLSEFILSSNQLSMGKKCLEFEELFSTYQNRKYSVLFNSGSSANLALIQAVLNIDIIKKDDLVGFSSLTWATNVMPLIQLGLNPVPIDVSLKTLNINSSNFLDSLKNSKLKSLFITNLLGFCDDIDKIKEICDKNKIIILEDNCESFGSEYKKIKLGNYSLASTFSFYVGHHMSTIEGGIVCTDDKQLYDMLVMVRAHGWTRNLDQTSENEMLKKHNVSEFYNKYTFYFPGYNLRPTEINGFLGIEQLKYANEIIKLRENNFKEFHLAAMSNNDFFKLNFENMDIISNFAYPLICKDKQTFDYYINKFKENNIDIRPIVGGSMVDQPFFKDFLSSKGIRYECKNSTLIHNQGFYFPNNPELTNEEKKRIIHILKNE